jgi:hypothetical protein
LLTGAPERAASELLPAHQNRIRALNRASDGPNRRFIRLLYAGDGRNVAFVAVVLVILVMPNCFLLTIVALMASAAVVAAPHVPTTDAEVLEHLPLRANDRSAQELRQLRAQVAANPNSVQLAAALAQRYIEIGRADADPRFFGYAQAALAPWWNKPKAPLAVLLLRATLRQSTHQFDSALADLEVILKAVPEHPQALLTRATVQQVRGNFDAAKRDCEALGELVDALVSTACLTNVSGATGALRASYEKLKQTLASNPQAEAGVASWVTTQLAEMAVRAGDSAAAEQHFRSALGTNAATESSSQGNDKDAYLLAAYADFLLDQKRPREVIKLLQDSTRADGLLLRYALAQQRVKLPQAAASIASLNARFEAARRRGERVHLREEARFQLELVQAPQQALQLAGENWAVQKEPADARVLLEAALAAKSKPAAQPVLDWLTANKLEDQTLQQLRTALERL